VPISIARVAAVQVIACLERVLHLRRLRGIAERGVEVEHDELVMHARPTLIAMLARKSRRLGAEWPRGVARERRRANQPSLVVGCNDRDSEVASLDPGVRDPEREDILALELPAERGPDRAPGGLSKKCEREEHAGLRLVDVFPHLRKQALLRGMR